MLDTNLDIDISSALPLVPSLHHGVVDKDWTIPGDVRFFNVFFYHKSSAAVSRWSVVLAANYSRPLKGTRAQK